MNFKLDYKKHRKAFLSKLLLNILISLNISLQLSEVQEPSLLIIIAFSILIPLSTSIVIVQFFKKRHKTIIEFTDNLLTLQDLGLKLKLKNIQSVELKYSTLTTYLVINLKKSFPQKTNLVNKIKGIFNFRKKDNSIKIELDKLNHQPKEVL